ncbi:MAG: Uncharacterised protein [Flavobacteriales bacterium UBA4585]|nr:MAG: Uncharacterised protein [Flavobacteriales bacterium UBA4585]
MFYLKPTSIRVGMIELGLIVINTTVTHIRDDIVRRISG